MEKEIIQFKEIDFPIKIIHMNMSRGESYRGMHSHLAVEGVIVKNGELNCQINNENLILRKNDIIFINSNTGHCLSGQNAEISYFQVDFNFFIEKTNDEDFSNLERFISYRQAKPYLKLDSSKEVCEIFEKIDAKHQENDKISRLYLRAYIYELFAFLCSHEFIMTTVKLTNQIKKIRPIVDFIDANFKSNITLDEICEVVGYNKYAICHYFKAVTGATVFDYINFSRVQFAVELLKVKENSILEIALDSGFSSPTYFNRVFKGIMGCSPSTYRRILAENIKKA